MTFLTYTNNISGILLSRNNTLEAQLDDSYSLLIEIKTTAKIYLPLLLTSVRQYLGVWQETIFPQSVIR